MMKKNFYQVTKIASVTFLTLTFALPKANANINKINNVVENTSSSLPYPQPEFQNNLGSFSVDFTGRKINKDEFESNLNKYFGLDDKSTFLIARELKDDLGNIIYSYQHYYNSIAVDGDMFFVVTKNNLIQTVNGQLVKIKDLDTNFSISNDQAKEIAYKKLGVKEGVIESEIKELIVKQDNQEKTVLNVVKNITLFSSFPTKIVSYFIDGKTGELLYSFNKIYHADAPSTSATLYRGNQGMTVDTYNGAYRLKDNARNIHTRNGSGWNGSGNSQTGEFTGTITEYTSNTANFTNVNHKPAVEVHWGMSKTYDYYKNIHNRNSYDGNGSIIRNYYNPPTTLFQGDNAGAVDQSGIVGMVYGAGDQYFTPVVALDVAGHEYSHLVISRNGSGGLDYLNESGALNESFADMFGAAIEFYVNQSPNWTIGEGLWKLPQITPNYMRNLANPNAAPAAAQLEQPDTYKGKYWKATLAPGVTGDKNNDWGGVHTNSGVGNYWFYLLSVGGKGVNDINKSYYVAGIGIQKAEKIAYRALTTGLSKTATYMDAYNATKNAAAALYGANSNEWNQVVNAWYAVGIGNAPAANQNLDMQTKLNVYPNPATGDEVYIESSLESATTVEMYDLSGKKVMSSLNLDYKTTINIANYASGMYILKFKSSLGEYSHKLMIK